jgi:hypothetical protein
MWRHPGPNCPDHSILAEPTIVEVNSWVQRILALKAHQHFGSGQIPLRDGVIRSWVSLLEPIAA